MPKGPWGKKRPADVIGTTIHAMRIVTGEVEDTPEEPKPGKDAASRWKRPG